MPAAPIPIRTEHLPFVAQVPFRSFFLIGIAQLLIALALWLAELGTRLELWSSPTPAWPAGVLHAASMLFGVFPFFVFGFTFNAFPKWHQRGPLAPPLFLAVAGLLAGGWLLLYASLAWRSLLAPAFGLIGAGWLLGLTLQIEIVRRPGFTPWHTRGVTIAVAAGGIGLAMLGHALNHDNGVLMQAAVAAGVWWFAAPLFFIAAQRVIPMFDGFVVPKLVPYQPNAALLIACAAFFAHGWSQMAGLPRVAASADTIAATVLWLHVARWPLRAIWQQRVLAMLHTGFGWFAVAMTLNAATGFGLLGIVSHALYLGGFGSLLFAMATRVTQGRVENKRLIESQAWTLFCILQFAVLSRVVSDLLASPAVAVAHLFSAALCLLAFGTWAARNLQRFLR